MVLEATHLILELEMGIIWQSNSSYVKTEDFYLNRTNSGPNYKVNHQGFARKSKREGTNIFWFMCSSFCGTQVNYEVND